MEIKVKLLEEVNGTPKDSIVGVDEAKAQALIEFKKAIKYTPEIEKEERDLAIKGISKSLPKTKGIKKMSDEKYLVGKSFSELVKQAKGSNGKIFESKAVVGMSEGGSNTGADLVYTALSEMTGLWAGATSIYDKCAKRQLPAGASAVNVNIDTFTEYEVGTAPIIGSVAEGDVKSVNAAPTVSQLVQPKVVQCIIGVTDEELEDVPYLDAYLRRKMTQKFQNKKDQLILAGTYGATVGFYGISTVGANYVTDVTFTTPTLAQILNFEKAIEPQLRGPGCEWVIGNSNWAAIKSAFMNSGNLDESIVSNNTLLGYPVNVTGNVNDVILGNWNEYTVVESRNGEVIDSSIHVYFTTNQTLFRITAKIGGTPTYRVRTAADSSTVGAFAAKA